MRPWLREMESKLLLLIAFVSGMSIMALEMCASRLLAPYFGTSIFVWANIIGVTMISLSLGYYYGGRLADRRPAASVLFSGLAATGAFAALIPFAAPPVMALSVRAVHSDSASLFYASLFATVLLFTPPLTALGGVAPFIIRLFEPESRSSGSISGRVFAISTVGSITGTFLPVLVMIPLLGTRATLLFFGSLLLFLGLMGLGRKRLAALAILLLIPGFIAATPRPGGEVLYEAESVHNHIQVVEKSNVLYLKLNEGYAYHSIYNPGSITVGGVWDYFNILPLLNERAEQALLIGLAGGTVAREYRYFFPEIKVDGVEIDGKVIEAGLRFFDMAGSNLAVYHMDGRAFLRTTGKSYDIVMVDAYKQPYIPFHLTTREFFQEVKEHLREQGVVAINVASLSPSSRLVRALENTLAAVFENVYVLHPPGTLNYLLIASDTSLELNMLPRSQELREIASTAQEGMRRVERSPDLPVLTDDRAPVEMYTDLMIFKYLRREGSRGYVQLFE